MRSLMCKKSFDLMTAIVKYFNSTLLFLCHGFFGMPQYLYILTHTVNTLKRLGSGSTMYDTSKANLAEEIKEYDQAVFDLALSVVASKGPLLLA